MMNDRYLMHYGVKGMKWGVRKDRDKVLTRDIHAKDLNDIYRSLSVDDRRKVMGIDKGSKDVPNSKFTTNQQLISKEHVKTFLVKHGDVPVSAFSIWNAENGEVELSLMTRSGYGGKGYATRAVEHGVKWLDSNPDIKSAYWDVRKDNSASIHLAKKSGFKITQDNNNWAVYSKKK